MSEISDREVEATDQNIFADETPSGTSNTVSIESKPEEICPVPIKRRKLSDKASTAKLEQRLGGILCCAVCLDLPSSAVYQCANGHLMCAACFTHLLADARLRDETSTCPNCRVEISKCSASRNLAVEKAISELPSKCQFCAQEFPRHTLETHEENKCEESVQPWKFTQIVVNGSKKRNTSLLDGLVRIVSSIYVLLAQTFRRSYYVSQYVENKRKFIRLTGCKFARIGCPWKGPYHELTAHEKACGHPNKTGADVMDVLIAKDKLKQEEEALYNQVFNLLSFEKITFNDLQLKPYRTDEFVNKLYYETLRFSALNQQWVVKAHVNNDQRDPTQSFERSLTYQLILKTKLPRPMVVYYLAIRGPYGDTALKPRIHSFTFSGPEENNEAPPVPLPLVDERETNRLLSNKAIHFRLIMFLS